jgi:hypothetical protein
MQIQPMLLVSQVGLIISQFTRHVFQEQKLFLHNYIFSTHQPAKTIKSFPIKS